MRSVEVRHGSATDVGLVREVNEDALLERPPVFVVADGMGGHDGGDVASAIVVEEFDRLAEAGYDPTRGPETVAATLRTCHERIEKHVAEQRAAGQPSYQAGTTAVVALLVEADGRPGWLVANVGDSRAYSYDEGLVFQVSIDHSLVQELVDGGNISAADAAQHPERNIVTRALGGPELPEADYFLVPFETTPRLLLCTDGVNEMLLDDQIAMVLSIAGEPAEAASELVAAAVAAGGRDNATAVVIDVVGWESDSEHPS